MQIEVQIVRQERSDELVGEGRGIPGGPEPVGGQPVTLGVQVTDDGTVGTGRSPVEMEGGRLARELSGGEAEAESGFPEDQ